MPPKILFSEEENSSLILFIEQSEMQNNVSKKDYVENQFFQKFSRNISYLIIRKQYLSINKLKRDLSDFTLNNTTNQSKKHISTNKTDSIPTQIIENNSSDDFLSFLNNKFDRDQTVIRYKESLKFFLFNFNLKEIMINDDGLCFISAIRTYFKNVLNIEYSFENVKETIFNFFAINKIENIIESGQKNNYLINLNSSLNKYLIEKRYDSDFVDEITNYATNIFNIHIIIFNTNESEMITNIYYLKPTIDLFQNRYIILNRQSFIYENRTTCTHYNLITSITTNNNSIINKISQQFERNTMTKLTNNELIDVSIFFLIIQILHRV